MNYTGNYWNDWTASDSNGDGIADAPYALDGGAGAADNYPLVVQWRQCGDVNRDGVVNMMDAGGIIAHTYWNVPLCNPWAADVNCDSAVNLVDAGVVIAHIYQGVTLENCCKGC